MQTLVCHWNGIQVTQWDNIEQILDLDEFSPRERQLTARVSREVAPCWHSAVAGNVYALAIQRISKHILISAYGTLDIKQKRRHRHMNAVKENFQNVDPCDAARSVSIFVLLYQ